jgi:hypothetical protein
MGLLFQFGNSRQCYNYEQKAITMSRKEGDYVTNFLKLSPQFFFLPHIFSVVSVFEVSVLCFLGMEMVLVA